MDNDTINEGDKKDYNDDPSQDVSEVNQDEEKGEDVNMDNDDKKSSENDRSEPDKLEE